MDKESGYHVYRIKTVPDLSPILTDIGLMVGDIAQNLRSILDHLTWQLACWFTDAKVKRETSVQFPIVTSRLAADGTDLWAAACKRNLGEVHPDHAAQMEGYQPYHGVNGRPDGWSGDYVHQLALLQDLSNTDKHLVLNTVLTVPNHFRPLVPKGCTIAQRSLEEMAAEFGASNSANFAGMQTDDVRFDHARDLVELDAEVCRMRLEGPRVPVRMEMAGDVTPSISLLKGRCGARRLPVPGRPCRGWNANLSRKVREARFSSVGSRSGPLSKDQGRIFPAR